jgi:hypothetical protein
MRRIRIEFFIAVTVFAACAPSEVPRTNRTEETKPVEVISRADSSMIPVTDSVDLATLDTVDQSLPLDSLRDSLSVRGNPEPAIPMVFENVCPGEGCEFGRWLVCDTLRARSATRDDAPIAFTALREDTLLALTGTQIIERAGKLVFRDTVQVTADGARYLFTAADTLFPLSYDGEGMGTWFFHGRLGGGSWFFHDDEYQFNPKMVMVRKRVTKWWVKARNPKGAEGWFEHRPALAIQLVSHYDPDPHCRDN